MRRRYAAVAGVAVAMGTGLWALPLTSAGADDDHGEDGDHEVIRVMSREVDSADLDLGRRGFSIGDRFVFSDNLFRRGNRVGTDHGDCVTTRIQGPGSAFQCTATAVLRGGQITAQGAVMFREDSSSRFTLAITGGTGRFRDAGGEVVVHETGNTTTVLTFKLED
jgi:hypothetical protein